LRVYIFILIRTIITLLCAY